MLTSCVHPDYGLQDWDKYRATYQGGRYFVERYLKRYNKREDEEDFKHRRDLTYCPAFAEGEINEIRNSIFQRMNLITRTSKSESYIRAVDGKGGGVDLKGNSMNSFIGQHVLPEIMTMGKVGVYVDMPNFSPVSSLAEFQKAPSPYVYLYRAENIMSWDTLMMDGEQVFLSVLLRESQLSVNSYGLPDKYSEKFRFLKLTTEGVQVQVWSKYMAPNTKVPVEKMESNTLLSLTRIPFILGDIGKSLLNNIADYQIALLNLESSDINYILNSNFPFYVEPYDAKADAFQNQKIEFDAETGAEKVIPDTVAAGPNRGRKYPMGANPPEFIHPSPEPLKASMEKEAQIKADMRQLLNLNLANVSPSRISAEAKRVDMIGLESGLSAIGLEVEGMERAIAEIWCEYEGLSKEEILVKYPENYQIKSDAQRIQEAQEYNQVKEVAPSRTFAKELSKKAAITVLGGQITSNVMNTILQEIDKANYICSNAKEIQLDLASGLVTTETASTARGYDGQTEAPKAAQQHAERLARIAEAQTKGTNIAGVSDINQNTDNRNTEDSNNTQE